jgi:hypothetical protein
LIAAYVGNFRNFERAISIWTALGGKKDVPIKDKHKLKILLIEAINENKVLNGRLRV